MTQKVDRFQDYLEHGTDDWHWRALIDRSYDSSMPEKDTNVTLATYGDAVLKLALCEILLDRVEELTIEKAKYESDVSLVRIAEHYELLKYLRFDRNSPLFPQDYQTRKMDPSFNVSKKERIRKFNRRRKYIATAVEAVLGAMYQAHRDFEEIKEVVRGWMEILK